MAAQRRRFVLIHPASPTSGYYEGLANCLVAGFRAAGVEAFTIPVNPGTWDLLRLDNASVNSFNEKAIADVKRGIRDLLVRAGATDTFAINRARRELLIPDNVTHHCWVHDPYDAPVDYGTVGDRSWMLAGFWTAWWGGEALLPATDFGKYHQETSEWDADISFAGYMPPILTEESSTEHDKPPADRGPMTLADERHAAVMKIRTMADKAIVEELNSNPSFVSDRNFAGTLVDKAGARLGFQFEGPLRDMLIRRTRSDIVRYVQRDRLLRFLIPLCERRGWRLKLAGSGWEKYAPAKPYFVGTLRSGPELATLYQRTKVNLQVNGDCNVHPRLMEGLACGSFILSEECATDTQPHGLRAILDPDCAPTFRDFNELEALLERYIENNALRQEAVRRGGEIVRSQHTYEARAAQILAA